MAYQSFFVSLPKEHKQILAHLPCHFADIVIVFKKDKDGLRYYMNPPIIDLIFSFSLTLNYALNTTWVFTWDREELVTSCAVLIFMALTNILCTGYIAYKISFQNHELKKSNPKLYFCYVMVMNGQGLYATWTVIASLINLGSALRYVSMISMQDTSNVCLSLLLVFSVVYFALENTVLDQKLRFLLTPYFGKFWTYLVKDIENLKPIHSQCWSGLWLQWYQRKCPIRMS